RRCGEDVHDLLEVDPEPDPQGVEPLPPLGGVADKTQAGPPDSVHLVQPVQSHRSVRVAVPADALVPGRALGQHGGQAVPRHRPGGGEPYERHQVQRRPPRLLRPLPGPPLRWRVGHHLITGRSGPCRVSTSPPPTAPPSPGTTAGPPIRASASVPTSSSCSTL